MPILSIVSAASVSSAILLAGAGGTGVVLPEPQTTKSAITEPATVSTPGPIEVDPTAYATANWPSHNKDLYANDFQGKKLAVPLGGETWLTEETDLNGRVLVLDFWATWCGPCIAAGPKLEKAKKDAKGAVEIVAISGQGETADTIRSYLGQHEPKWTYLHDDAQRAFKPFESRGIPLVVVLSTDGVVRWMGNPHAKAFAKAVDQVVKNDPLIQAIRAAKADG